MTYKRTYTLEQMIDALQKGGVFVVDRRDTPELPDLEELERLGFVESGLIVYGDQPCALKFRWKYE